MPTVEQLTQQIADLRKKTVPLGEYQTGPEFGEVLRERLTRPEEIENLIKRIAEQRSRLLTIPAETRAEAPIGAFSPTQVAGLIAEREEPVRATWETLRGVKATREGRLEEIIERATRGYEAQIEKQESKYEQERQKLEDLMAERDWIAGQSYKAKQLELEEKRVAVAERPPEPTEYAPSPYEKEWQAAGGETGTGKNLMQYIAWREGLEVPIDIADLTSPEWVHQKRLEAEAAGDKEEIIKADLRSLGVPEELIEKEFPPLSPKTPKLGGLIEGFYRLIGK